MSKLRDFLFFKSITYKNFIWLYRNISKRNKLRLLKLIFLMILSAISEVISITAIIPFLSLIIDPENIEKFYILNNFFEYLDIENKVFGAGLLLIIANIVTPFLRLLNIKKSGQITAEIGSDFSYKLYKINLNQNYSEYVKENSSSLISAANSDIGRVVLSLSGINAMITGFFIAFFILINLFFINKFIAIYSLFIFSSSYLIIAQLTKKRLLINSKIVAKNIKRQINLIQEIFGSIREVLLYGIQDNYLENYIKIDFPMRKLGAENLFLASFPKYILESIGIIFIVFISLSIYNSGKNSLEIIPIVGIFALSAQRLLPSLQMIYSGWSTVKGNQSNLERVKSLISKKVPSENKFSTSQYLDFKNKICFQNVNFKFNESSNYIFKNLNFEIFKGESIGIVGETGTGKSTMLNMLMGFLYPNEGNIYVDNKKIAPGRYIQNLKMWQKLIAYVPQNIYLKDSSFIENIAFGIEVKNIDLEKVKKVAQESQIIEYIESTKLGFNNNVGERGVLLSGGQAQRLALARALYRDSKILILDEATSALDTNTEKKIIKSIFSLEKDITLIMIAHRLSSLKYCDRIFSLENKQLKEIKYESLIKNN